MLFFHTISRFTKRLITPPPPPPPHTLVFGGEANIPSSFSRGKSELTYVKYLDDFLKKLNETQSTAAQRLLTAKWKSKKYYDQKLNVKNFSVRDQVLLLKEPRSSKLDPQYSGPYAISQLLGNTNAEIQWSHIIFPKRHFIESPFCRNPILPNRYFSETKNCRKSFDRIVKLTKLHNAERHFSESLFNRTSFSQIVLQPNVVFPKQLESLQTFFTNFIPLINFDGNFTELRKTLALPPYQTSIELVELFLR